MKLTLAVVLSLTVFAPAPDGGDERPMSVQTVAQPGSAEAYFLFLKAKQLESNGDVEGAIALYRQASLADPASGEVLAQLAALYARENRPREAIATAESALKRNPDTVEAHFVLGSVYAAYAESAQPAGSATARAAMREYAEKAIPHLEAVQKARGAATDPGVMLALGRLYMRTSAFDKAIAALTPFTEQQPDAAEGVALLAQAYEQAGRISEAIELLQRTVEREPSFYPALADLYEQAGRWAEAADAYRKVAEDAGDAVDVKRRWAVALLNSGRPGDQARARDLLQQVLTANPVDTRALYLLSQTETRLGDLAAAESTARKLIAVDPEGISGPYALAQIFEQRRDYRKVVEILQPVVDRAAGKPAATRGGADLTPLLVHLGFAYLDLEQADKAIATFERAGKIAPENATIDVGLAQADIVGKRYQAAVERAEKARAKYPGDARLVRLEAEALRQLQQVDRAVALLEQLRRDQPTDVDSHVALAELLARSDRSEQACAVLTEALAKFPDDLAVLFELGAVRERQKKYAEAEDAFRKVIARDPKHAQALNYLGYMLADRGVRLAESVEYIRRALAIEPHNPAYLDSLGWAYFKMNRLDLAEQNLREAAARRGGDSVVQEHWGDLLSKLGRRSEAVAAWRRALAGDGESIDRAAIEAKIRKATTK